MPFPTKEYQLWWDTGEGFAFEEFSTQSEIAEYVKSGQMVGCGRFCVTRLQSFSVELRNFYPPQPDPAIDVPCTCSHHRQFHRSGPNLTECNHDHCNCLKFEVPANG